MSLALSSTAEPVEEGRSQQQDEDDGHVCRGTGGAGGLLQSPTVALPRALFALQLRSDGVAPSPDRERRGQASPMFGQLKSPMVLGTEASPFKQLHLQIQKLKEALQVMRVEKDTEIAFLRDQLAQHHVAKRDSCDSAPVTPTSPTLPVSRRHNDLEAVGPQLVPWMHSITERGDIHTTRLGRHASLQSTRILAALQTQHQQTHDARVGVALAERIAAAFLNPVLSLPYLHSIQFGADLVELSAHVGALLETESRCLALASPVYVFGDLHGNWSDLSFFVQHFWRLGVGLAAGTFLFLGDYVDRGASSLECVAYLFAQKLLHPHKVVLLRGNHETRAVNGRESFYGSGCFLTQCRARFGRDEGAVVWHHINHAFDRLPLAATIDSRVFCVHGGIPRRLSSAPGDADRLASIHRLPAAVSLDVLDKASYDANPQLRMVSDLLWGDPAREHHEPALDPLSGFGPSVQRGGSAVSFGDKAITDFLKSHDLTHILRAHEAHGDGVAVAKRARVVTIFSTSKDHALGDDATCGCVLVDRDRIVAVNRAATSGAAAVRRRRSVACLPPTSASASAFAVTSAPAVSTLSRTSASASTSSAVASREDAEDARPSPSSPPTGATPRRRASHRDGPTTTAVTAYSRPSDQDESDSTDDEAPPRISTRSSRSARRQSRATGHENNQSED